MRNFCILLAVALLLLVQVIGLSVVDRSKTLTHFRSAQAAVKDNFVYDPMLSCKSAGLHGLVKKERYGSESVGSVQNMDITTGAFMSFHRIPVYASCQLYLSRLHKMVFIRQPKSSSTSILAALQETFPGLHGRKAFVAVSSIDDALWNEYFVFTWVRNPFTRTISAFDMMNNVFLFQRQGETGEDVGEHCHLTLAEYAKNSNTLRTICPARGCCPYIPEYKRWVPWFIDQHINDQAHCTFTPSGESMVDFIGRSEEIETDWAEFLAVVNRRRNTDYKPAALNNANGHGKAENNGVQHACASSETQKMLGPEVMRDIAMQYASDMHLFKFLP